MTMASGILGRVGRRRALALLACAALLYLASGATVLHHHSKGPESACHFCQSLHLPALASGTHNLLVAPQWMDRFWSRPTMAMPSDSVSLHRASRAPPSV
jgi:hypothetical protein